MAREKERETLMKEAGLIPSAAPSTNTKDGTASARDSTGSLASNKGGVGKGPAGPVDEEEEALKTRLEAIGVHVGSNFSERCDRLSSGLLA